MQSAPRYDSIVLQLVRARNGWLALAAVGLLSCIPVINFVIFGYAIQSLGKYTQTGRFDFEKPSEPETLIRDSLIVGLAALAYAGLPFWLGRALGKIVYEFASFMPIPISRILGAAGGVVGLGLFGAAFILYLRSREWESLLNYREIASLARNMASAIWLPVVAVFGLSLISSPLWNIGLGLGVFFYCIYLGEIARRIA